MAAFLALADYGVLNYGCHHHSPMLVLCLVLHSFVVCLQLFSSRLCRSSAQWVYISDLPVLVALAKPKWQRCVSEAGVWCVRTVR